MTWSLPRETCQAYAAAIRTVRVRLSTAARCQTCVGFAAEALIHLAAYLEAGIEKVPDIGEPPRDSGHSEHCSRYEARAFPICPECGTFVRLGGEVDDTDGRWFHARCLFSARNRRTA